MPPAALDLATLTAAQGFVINGVAAGDRSGFSVASAGDVNGDGIDDLIIGAPDADPGGRGEAGESYVVFGRAGGFADSLSLGLLDGSNGFRLEGIDQGGNSGCSVASAGDVNGDGIDDLIIGAYRASPGGRDIAGESYVVFGKTGGFAAGLSLSALDGSNGFRIEGIDVADLSGYSVASAGDVNGDGFDDLIIGAIRAEPGGRDYAGESYVVFGRDGGFAASLSLGTLDGNNGFRLDGIDTYDRSGRSVASAGDVNGDGIDDLIIGALFAAPGGRTAAGESYVVFGTRVGFAASLTLGTLDGSNGFRIEGVAAGDVIGFSLASAGDVNGDGIDDLIIGAFLADPGGRNAAGESYVVFGKTEGFGASLSLGTLDGSNGFRLDGIDENDFSGSSVASAGDVNGDGLSDLIIGAQSADPGGRSRAGESYVVFGRAGGFAATLQLGTLDGNNGFRLDGIDTYDFSGVSVASAGDINGDGLDDLIIGAPYADPGGRNNAGESYVIFGTDGFGPSLSGDFAFTVAEGGSVTLTTADLSGVDAVSGAEALTYTVVGPVSGFVALASAPAVAITSFTQAQLAAGQVRFLHDGSDSGASSFSIVLRDAAGNATDTRTVTATVTPTDDPLGAVTDVNGADNSVAENAATGATVGITARALDPDAGDTVTYTLTDNAGDRFAINASTGVVTVAGPLDFETATSHQITVQATSSGGDSQSLGFTIQVTDIAERLNIFGTAAKDRLLGTAADEAFFARAGADNLTGRGGFDLFVFGAETGNRVRETDTITDFRAGDLLDLGDATIVREIHSGGSTRLVLSGDGDTIVLTGLADFTDHMLFA